MNVLRAQAVELGARPGIPLWITEIGWSTCALRPRCVNERDQARRIAGLFTLLATQQQRAVDAVFLYHQNDLYGSPRDPEQRFGLITREGRRKPAYRTLRQITGGPRR